MSWIPAGFRRQLERLFNGSVTSGDISYRELTDIGQVMRDLKGKGICVGLATADTLYSAESCLKKLAHTRNLTM